MGSDCPGKPRLTVEVGITQYQTFEMKSAITENYCREATASGGTKVAVESNHLSRPGACASLGC